MSANPDGADLEKLHPSKRFKPTPETASKTAETAPEAFTGDAAVSELGTPKGSSAAVPGSGTGRARSASPERPGPNEPARDDHSMATVTEEPEEHPACSAPPAATAPPPRVHFFCEGLGHYSNDVRGICEGQFAVEASDKVLLPGASNHLQQTSVDVTETASHAGCFASVLTCPYANWEGRNSDPVCATQALIEGAANAAAAARVSVFILSGRQNYTDDNGANYGRFDLYNYKAIQEAGYVLSSMRRFAEDSLSPNYVHYFTGAGVKKDERDHRIIQTVWVLSNDQTGADDEELRLYRENELRLIQRVSKFEDPTPREPGLDSNDDSKVQELVGLLDAVASVKTRRLLEG